MGVLRPLCHIKMVILVHLHVSKYLINLINMLKLIDKKILASWSETNVLTVEVKLFDQM